MAFSFVLLFRGCKSQCLSWPWNCAHRGRGARIVPPGCWRLWQTCCLVSFPIRRITSGIFRWAKRLLSTLFICKGYVWYGVQATESGSPQCSAWLGPRKNNQITISNLSQTCLPPFTGLVAQYCCQDGFMLGHFPLQLRHYSHCHENTKAETECPVPSEEYICPIALLWPSGCHVLVSTKAKTSWCLITRDPPRPKWLLAVSNSLAWVCQGKLPSEEQFLKNRSGVTCPEPVPKEGFLWVLALRKNFCRVLVPTASAKYRRSVSTRRRCWTGHGPGVVAPGWHHQRPRPVPQFPHFPVLWETVTNVTQSNWILLSHQRSWSNHIRALGNRDQTRCLQAPLRDTEPQKVKKLLLPYFIGFPLFAPCSHLQPPGTFCHGAWRKTSAHVLILQAAMAAANSTCGQGRAFLTHTAWHCSPSWQFDTSHRALFAALIRQSADWGGGGSNSGFLHSVLMLRRAWCFSASHKHLLRQAFSFHLLCLQSSVC